MTTLATFRRLIPEFEDESNDIVNGFLSDAVSEMNVAAWTEAGQLQRGAVYLAAHLMAVRKASEALATSAFPPSVVSNVTEDKLSIGFRDPSAGVTPGQTSLASTTYGQEYIRLRKKVILTPQLAE